MTLFFLALLCGGTFCAVFFSLEYREIEKERSGPKPGTEIGPSPSAQ